ncbi:MAG TPA: hypothetical protein VNJ08_11135 [Bacteriovoracaceae bacterium]|nr:hypothetical protein [Bacteriovoracaceae bacterium]
MKKSPEISLITDQSYLPKLLALLSKARKQIDILSFSFAIGSAAGKLNMKGGTYEIARKLKNCPIIVVLTTVQGKFLSEF